MKCLITEKDTNGKYGSLPLSKEGRGLLNDLRDMTNFMIVDKIVGSMKGKAEEKGDIFDAGKFKSLVEKNTPKLGNKTTLTALSNGDKIVLEALKEIKGE